MARGMQDPGEYAMQGPQVGGGGQLQRRGHADQAGAAKDAGAVVAVDLRQRGRHGTPDCGDRRTPDLWDDTSVMTARAPLAILGPTMTDGQIPHEYHGWWRILETSQWVNDDIDICGTALLSLTGLGDRLRMFVLLATVDCKATKTGISFTWEGAWEFDQVSGTGSVKLGKDGRLNGKFRIKNGDDSTFIAERTEAPKEPIPNPPSYRDKWRRRW